jgi:hypothetical protein
MVADWQAKVHNKIFLARERLLIFLIYLILAAYQLLFFFFFPVLSVDGCRLADRKLIIKYF